MQSRTPRRRPPGSARSGANGTSAELPTVETSPPDPLQPSAWKRPQPDADPCAIVSKYRAAVERIVDDAGGIAALTESVRTHMGDEKAMGMSDADKLDILASCFKLESDALTVFAFLYWLVAGAPAAVLESAVCGGFWFLHVTQGLTRLNNPEAGGVEVMTVPVVASAVAVGSGLKPLYLASGVLRVKCRNWPSAARTVDGGRWGRLAIDCQGGEPHREGCRID